MKKNLFIVFWSILILSGCSSSSRDIVVEESDVQEHSPVLIDECLSFFDDVQYGDYIFTINDALDVYYTVDECGVVLGSAIPGTGKPVIVNYDGFHGNQAITVTIVDIELNYELEDTLSNPTATDLNALLSKSDNYLCINTSDVLYIYVLNSQN